MVTHDPAISHANAVVRSPGHMFLTVIEATKPAPIKNVALLSAKPALTVFELFFNPISVSIRVYLVFNLF